MDKRFPLEDQIDMLASALRGRVIAPGNADYDTVRLTAAGNFDGRRPAVVIRVATAADVAAALDFAQATDLEVAVRSGGHSIGGHSASNGGLVIDLRDLNGLEIDAKAATAWCGAGLTAGEVTEAVQQHGMIIGFGDAATVGIGGLTLGGGVGFLARKHGLTIDHLLAAEIVTASGDILVVDADHHADLFWAIRGGGGNFGVVTRLKYRMHPLPSFIGGPLILPATAEVLAGFVAAAEAAPDELTVIANVMPAPPLPFLPPALHGKTILMGMMAYAGGAEAAQRALAPFRALATPLADLVGPAPFSSMYIPEDPSLRLSVTCRSLFTAGIDTAQASEILAHLDRTDAPMKVAQVRVLGGATARVPAEATAYAHRKSRVLVGFLAMYPDPAETLAQDYWAEQGITALRRGEDSVYVNFLGTEGHDRIRAAYPDMTWNRLRAVKRQYDPENLFRLNQNIPPAA